MIDISSYFQSLGLTAGLTLIITGYLNTHALKTANSTIKQIVSWVVAIALAFVGMWKGIGMFSSLSIGWTIVSGLAVGLVANGIFDVALVQSILEFIKAKKPATQQ